MPVKLRMENIGLGTDELDPSFCYHAIFFLFLEISKLFADFFLFCLFLYVPWFRPKVVSPPKQRQV